MPADFDFHGKFHPSNPPAEWLAYAQFLLGPARAELAAAAREQQLSREAFKAAVEGEQAPTDANIHAYRVRSAKAREAVSKAAERVDLLSVIVEDRGTTRFIFCDTGKANLGAFGKSLANGTQRTYIMRSDEWRYVDEAELRMDLAAEWCKELAREGGPSRG